MFGMTTNETKNENSCWTVKKIETNEFWNGCCFTNEDQPLAMTGTLAQVKNQMIFQLGFTPNANAALAFYAA
jgi:hypothetical protein